MEKKRSLIWLGFLAGATTLAIIPELFWDDEQLVQPAPSYSPEQPDVAAVQAILRAEQGSQPAAHLPAEQQAIPRADLFPAHSWYVAPPVPDIPPPAAPRVMAPVLPAAPPVPFQFVGTLRDNEQLHIVLQRNQTIHVVSVGDVIDETYRVEGLRGREVILVYLPLDLNQSVLVGSTAGSAL